MPLHAELQQVDSAGDVEQGGYNRSACHHGSTAAVASKANRSDQELCNLWVLHVHVEAVLCRIPSNPFAGLRFRRFIRLRNLQ